MASAKQNIYEIRQHRIAKGLCITCEDPAGINTSDGKVSRYCDECKADLKAKRQPAEHSTARLLCDRPQRADVYGVDAPDYTESDLFKSIAIKVTGIVFQFGEITAGEITRTIVGDMEPGRERRRREGYVADAIQSLVSARVIEPHGVLWVKYRKATPVEVTVAEIDGHRLNEFNAYNREKFAAYPTVGNYYFGQ